jgi:hypothetical protein
VHVIVVNMHAGEARFQSIGGVNDHKGPFTSPCWHSVVVLAHRDVFCKPFGNKGRV